VPSTLFVPQEAQVAMFFSFRGVEMFGSKVFG
jgi:hypothetical protein